MHTCTYTCTHQGLDPVTPTVDCGAPQFTCGNSNVSLSFTSTLEGSNLQFSCMEGYLPRDVFTATCHPNGSWVPDPTSHVCTTASAASGIMHDSSNFYEWRSSHSFKSVFIYNSLTVLEHHRHYIASILNFYSYLC